MATLDDKLLGEKLHNYCSSSSEDEGDKDDKDKSNEDKNEREKSKTIKGPKFIPDAEATELENWSGSAQNTGPKGVIKDWQRYKQLEQEKNVEAQRERDALVKKLAMTCRSDDLKDEKTSGGKHEQHHHHGGHHDPKAASTSSKNEISLEELENSMMQDEFFQEYLRKKLEEMKKRTTNLPTFGKVIELTGDQFLNEIDHEHKNVTVIVHIYDQKMSECRTMNECLETIAHDYPFVKFCRIKSTEVNLSEKFRKMGCPALLIYKNAEMIGNFVRMGDEFGQEFCASDVENFLLEQSFLPSNDLVSTIRDSNVVTSNE